MTGEENAVGALQNFKRCMDDAIGILIGYPHDELFDVDLGAGAVRASAFRVTEQKSPSSES